MDGARFDHLARAFAARLTRRRGLAVVGALALGSAVATTATDAAAGLRLCRNPGIACTANRQCCSGTCAKDRTLPRRQRNRCACPQGATLCGESCSDLQADTVNCGACGVTCAEGQGCCGGTCTALVDHNDHCGACGNPCVAGETCCGVVCATTRTNSSHCGACNVACPEGQQCSGGVCVSSVCADESANREDSVCVIDAAGNVYPNLTTFGALVGSNCGSNRECEGSYDCLFDQTHCLCLTDAYTDTTASEPRRILSRIGGCGYVVP